MKEFLLTPLAYAGSITSAPDISSILGNVLDFLLSIVGVVAILGLIVAGVMYLTAAGDMRKIALAKRMTIASIIGIMVVIGALIIVNQLAVFFL